MKKSTHIQNQKDKAAGLRDLVCILIGCTVEEYDAYQKKEGRMFLQSSLSGYPSDIDEIEATESYWAWWRNHWMQRDECFIAMGAETLPGLSRKNLYSKLNDYRGLLNEVNPNKQVLEMGFADMIGRVIREIKSKEHAD